MILYVSIAINYYIWIKMHTRPILVNNSGINKFTCSLPFDNLEPIFDAQQIFPPTEGGSNTTFFSPPYLAFSPNTYHTMTQHPCSVTD